MASVEGSGENFPHLLDEGECFESTCDMHLIVEDVKVPVHSQALIMHSRFFRKLIADIRKGEVEACGDGLGLNLDKATKLGDMLMLLTYLYNRDATVDKFEDAIVLVTLADKFDMPSIIKICEPILCEETANMHFAGFNASRPHGCGKRTNSGSLSRDIQPLTNKDDTHDAARWLSMAERWELSELQVKCQALILQTLAYTKVGSSEAGFSKLHEHRISLRSIYTIATVLGQCVGEFGKCPCGRMFSSLRCASCYLENTPQVSRAMCESWLLKYSDAHKL